MVQDFKDKTDVLMVNVPATKTNVEKSFAVTGEFLEIYKKYAALRPQNLQTKSFFLNYQRGKCTRQPIGITKIGAMPRTIAEFLKLPDAARYTGHCWRRSSATTLVNSGADILTLKRHGGWKSTSVAESYVEESDYQKKIISEKITEAVMPKPKIQPIFSSEASTSSAVLTTKKESNVGGNIFVGCIGCNIVINLPKSDSKENQ